MNIVSNQKINFNSLEENTLKIVLKLGREIIQEQLRVIDKLILKYRDKDIFTPKDFQTTTIKSKLGEILISRRRYKMKINGETKTIHLLDKVLEINDFGLYSNGIVDMITREITKKSYRETAKTISQDTDNTISYSAVRNIVLMLGKKIKAIEEEKIKLYKDGKIEGTRNVEYVFCEHDGIYVKKQKATKNKNSTRKHAKQFKKKNHKKKKNGIELKIAVIHEGKEPRYRNDYKLKNKIIVGTAKTAKDLKIIEDTAIGTTYKEYAIKNVIINGDGADWTGSIVEGTKEIFQLDMAHIQKKIYMAVSDEDYLKRMQEIVFTENAKDIFSLIFNYKVELEYDKKLEELEKVKQLEEYLRNNEEAITRYQYKLGLKEEQLEYHIEDLPSLGSEESHMYCVCRNRMKKNRTGWSLEGAESLLKVIMNKMNGTLQDVINKQAEAKIKEELVQRIPAPSKVKKLEEQAIAYAGRYEIANNFTGNTRKFVIDLLKHKKCSELMLIN